MRITSGFGMRRHPLLLTGKMHYGVDWATAPGTPIMAAGDGVIEEAGAKGEYGNYIRIRHANGYKTAYGHMSRYAAGVSPACGCGRARSSATSAPRACPRVRTALRGAGERQCTSNPMSIQVPNDRQLDRQGPGRLQAGEGAHRRADAASPRGYAGGDGEPVAARLAIHPSSRHGRDPAITAPGVRLDPGTRPGDATYGSTPQL